MRLALLLREMLDQTATRSSPGMQPHPETLPSTSMTYDSTSQDEDNVLISIQSSPNCSSDDTSCYIVQNSDLHVNFVFQEGSSASVPSELAFVVVGDITSPLFSGLYDVPAALIESAGALQPAHLLADACQHHNDTGFRILLHYDKWIV